MKHNNLKKPAAVLTALALAAALLAGCGAPSDSMAASSAPAESEAVSTETPAESADEGDADEVAAKKCADLIDAIYVQVTSKNTTFTVGFVIIWVNPKSAFWPVRNLMK